MARPVGRSAQETKQLILAAATREILAKGKAVALSEIAEAASVSKGGLLYHFPTKDALLHALISDLIEQFRQQVREFAAGDQAAGCLNRAYIRASFAQAEDSSAMRDLMVLAAQFLHDEKVVALLQHDADRWRAELLDDGLAPEVVRLVVAASDGMGIAQLAGMVLDAKDRAELAQQLLALTR